MNGLKGHLDLRKHGIGAYFALAAAIISGFSIYINKFAVVRIEDPFIFTAAKNVMVAASLFALFVLPRALPELKRLSRNQWLTLGAIGCFGGGIPFLLFFYGLSLTSAASAGFIHKTLFIWVAVLAVFFLGERPRKIYLAALLTLVGGNVLLLGWPQVWPTGEGSLMVLAATILWAIEAIVAKKAMTGMSSNVAAFGRMFFGAVVMLVYLTLAGKLMILTSFGGQQIGWIALTGIFLLGYVSAYYAALKHAPASIVASILVLGSVITSLLYAILDARRYSWDQVAGMLLITAAAFVLWQVSRRIHARDGATSVAPVSR